MFSVLVKTHQKGIQSLFPSLSTTNNCLFNLFFLFWFVKGRPFFKFIRKGFAVRAQKGYWDTGILGYWDTGILGYPPSVIFSREVPLRLFSSPLLSSRLPSSPLVSPRLPSYPLKDNPFLP